MSTTLDKPNRYAATCVRCRGRIPAQQGLLARTDDGKWAADHIGECPDKPTVALAPVEMANRDGIYRHPDGTIYKVQQARQGSGRLYAKRLVITTCPDPACGHPTTTQPDGSHAHGHFVYAAGAIGTLQAAWRLEADAAAAFGQLYGICAMCGADLTDEKSIARGIGPRCAERF